MNKIQSILHTYPGKIYLRFDTPDQCLAFLREAEEEGFTFCDGVKPTQRHPSDLLALNPDRTINYVGFIGHIAWQCAGSMDGKLLHKLEYADLA